MSSNKVKVVVDDIDQQRAKLSLSDGQHFSVDLEFLPDNIKVGEEVYIFCQRRADSDYKAVINELLYSGADDS